jgi:hypothetical protein
MDAILAALDTGSARIEPRQFPYQIVERESSAPPPISADQRVA